MSIESIKGNLGTAAGLVGDAQKARVDSQDARHKATQPPAAAAAQGDRLSLTGQAALLKDVEKRIAALPVVDTDKVEKIRNDIKNGTYHIDPARVADKFLQIETQLMGRK